MNMENTNYEAPKHKSGKESGSDSTVDQTMSKRGAEAYGQAEQAVSDAYDKTSEKVSETYEKAKSYTIDNPGKTILIALGIGVGLGLLLSTGTHRSHNGRFARPVVNALSDIALGFFR